MKKQSKRSQKRSQTEKLRNRSADMMNFFSSSGDNVAAKTSNDEKETAAAAINCSKGSNEEDAPAFAKESNANATICIMAIDEEGIRRFLTLVSGVNSEMAKLDDNDSQMSDNECLKGKLGEFSESCIKGATSRSEHASKVCDMGGNTAIMAAFITLPDDASCLAEAIAIVKSLTSFAPELKENFVLLGVIDDVFAATERNADESLHSEALTCAAWFVEGAENSQPNTKIELKKHIDGIIRSMEDYPSNNDVQKSGCRLLHYLCVDADTADEITDLGGLYVASVGIEATDDKDVVMECNNLLDHIMDGTLGLKESSSFDPSASKHCRRLQPEEIEGRNQAMLVSEEQTASQAPDMQLERIYFVAQLKTNDPKNQTTFRGSL